MCGLGTTRLLSEEQLGLEPDSGPGCEIGIKLKTWKGKVSRSERGLVWLHSPWVLPTFCLSSALSSVCMAMISSEGTLGQGGSGQPHFDPSLPTIHATGPCDLCFFQQRTWSSEHLQQSQPGQGELHQGSLQGGSKTPGGSDGKESACNAGDLGSIPGSNVHFFTLVMLATEKVKLSPIYI